MKVYFSNDLDIRKNQEIAEKFNLYEVVKNIVNNGNPERNEGGTVEWEVCEIYYAPKTVGGIIGSAINPSDQMLAQIKILNGDVLYQSFSGKGGQEALGGLCDDSRHTKQFRMGKWVDRLLKYSEEISQQYQSEDRKNRQKAYAEKMKPFSEIDF